MKAYEIDKMEEKQLLTNLSDMTKNREKLENPLISGYRLEKMSNGRLYFANYQRYKKRVQKNNQ